MGPTLDAAGPGFAASAAGGSGSRRDKRKHDSNPNASRQQGPKGGGAGQGHSKKHRQAVKRNGLPKAKRVLSDAYRQKLLKEGKCLNCEEKGHFARECPNPAKEVPQGCTPLRIAIYHAIPSRTLQTHNAACHERHHLELNRPSSMQHWRAT